MITNTKIYTEYTNMLTEGKLANTTLAKAHFKSKPLYMSTDSGVTRILHGAEIGSGNREMVWYYPKVPEISIGTSDNSSKMFITVYKTLNDGTVINKQFKFNTNGNNSINRYINKLNELIDMIKSNKKII